MKWFFHIFVMRLRVTAKKPLLWLLLVLSAVFSWIPINAHLTSKQNVIPMGLVNLDGGAYAQAFITELATFSSFDFVQEETLDEAQRKLASGKYEGVVLILENFSELIAQAEFTKMIRIYISPSSSVASFVADLMAEKVVEIWAQEFLIQDYQALRTEKGKPMTEAELAQLRMEMRQVIQSEEIIVLELHTLQGDGTQEVTNRVSSGEDAIRQSVLYYSAMTVIFVFVSGRWVIEQRRNSIGLRMQSLGITPAISVLASSTAMAAFCTGVLILAIIGYSLMVKISLGFALGLVFTAILYFFSIVGLALIFTFFTRESISLLLISPLALLVNSLLGGMFYPLPDWAILWRQISILLPGRMLNLALYSSQYWPLIVGMVVYISVGVLIASKKTE